MSEANNVWRVEVDGTEHEVEVDYTLMGMRTITVDGEVIDRRRVWSFTNVFDFDVSGHPASVKISATYAGFGSQSSLHVDRRYVEPLRR